MSGPQGSFTADISGVLDTLAGIDLPLDPKAVEGIVSVAGSLDLSHINVSAEALGKQILEVAGTCRSPAICSAPSPASLKIAERFAEPSLETAITGLIDRLSAELDNLEGGPLGVFTRVTVLLKARPRSTCCRASTASSSSMVRLGSARSRCRKSCRRSPPPCARSAR